MTLIAGYDVGGAHLKVAVAENDRLIAVRQIVCPLWRGVEHLEAALAEAAAITAGAGEHRVTMTGELADVFPDRYTGVCRIVGTVAARLGPDVRFWMGPLQNFGTADDAMVDHLSVASTNFLASAAFLAARLPGRDGLLIDMGSTTTDIVPFGPRVRGAAPAAGLSDAERLANGSLVYTGLTRTLVTAVVSRGLFAGAWQGLAREPFATMADVYRVLETLPEEIDQHRTADGRSVSPADSAARLARCFGRDYETDRHDAWRHAAAEIAEQQVRSIHDGARQVLSLCGFNSVPLIVSAGIGAGRIQEVARRLGAEHRPFAEVADITGDLAIEATRHAPAVALALGTLNPQADPYVSQTKLSCAASDRASRAARRRTG